MTKKITLTQKENNDLAELINDESLDLYDILSAIRGDYNNKFTKLWGYLFGNATNDLNRSTQIDFIKNPASCIEVEQEKKYYVHLVKDDKCGYLNFKLNSGSIELNDYLQTGAVQTQFTKDELSNMKNLAFTIDNEALEEVEDEKE